MNEKFTGDRLKNTFKGHLNVKKNGNKLKELPNAKPFVLINEKDKIVYSNYSFLSQFNLNPGDDLSSIPTEPNIIDLISKFRKSSYLNYTADILVKDKNALTNKIYKIDILKLEIKRKEYCLLNIYFPSEQSKIEERVYNLSKAIEYSNLSVIVTDENGYITFVSRSFEDFFNKRLDKIYNNYLPYVLVEYLSKNDLSELKNAIAEKNNWSKIITDINRKNELWFKEIKLTVIKNNGDKPVSFIATVNDITHFILKNKYIKHSEEKQKAIINQISDPLIIVRNTDGELFIDNINELFQELFDIEKESVTDEKLKPNLNGDLYNEITKSIARMENSNYKTVSFNYKNENNGRSFIGKVSYIDDNIHRDRIFIIILTDITDHLEIENRLKQAYEREIQLNKLKSTFLANMSHEVRTPLNAIVGYAELLEDDLMNQNISSALEMINYLREGVDRLLLLVDNIVEVSLLESGMDDLDLMEIDLNGLVKDVTNDFDKSKKNLFVQPIILLCSSKLIAKTDEEKFRKIMQVLLDNAVKYNAQGGKVVVKTSKENGNAIIKIIDDGIGIHKSDIKKILHPFSQVEEESYKRKYEGAGLGLTIAHRLTVLLGGNLDIKSELNKGTTVTLSFPLVTRN